MVSPKNSPADSCDGCVRCEPAVSPAGAGEQRGWRVGLAAGGAFLLPPAAALAGGLLVAGGQAAQFLGTAGGLLLGLVLAAIGAKLFRKGPKEKS